MWRTVRLSTSQNLIPMVEPRFALFHSKPGILRKHILTFVQQHCMEVAIAILRIALPTRHCSCICL